MPRRVEIHVEDGVATIAYRSSDVEVEVRDYDVQGDDGETPAVDLYEAEPKARGSYCPEHGVVMAFIAEVGSLTYYHCPDQGCPGWTYNGDEGCYYAGVPGWADELQEAVDKLTPQKGENDDG